MTYYILTMVFAECAFFFMAIRDWRPSEISDRYPFGNAPVVRLRLVLHLSYERSGISTEAAEIGLRWRNWLRSMKPAG